MEKVYEVFERGIKREFKDVMIVEDAVSALDIYEYVVTKNVETILGTFFSYFFDDKELYPNLKMKCQFLQDYYRDRVGPGVWIRGFFGAGKSHFLKVLNTLLTTKEINYINEKDEEIRINVLSEIRKKISSTDVGNKISDIMASINPDDYLTFMFSSNHVTRFGEAITDALPRIIGEKMFGDSFSLSKENFTAKEVAELLHKWLKESGKKRMIIFIDEILDVLDTGEKVRKFEALIELLSKDIWLVVTSLEAKTKLLEVNTAERMKDRFGTELLLLPEEMVKIVRDRYLVKKSEAEAVIVSKIETEDKYKYLFPKSYSGDSEDGAINKSNLVKSYPFYPFQLAYLKEILKNENRGSERNLMKIVKAVIKNEKVYNAEIGEFINIELFYEEIKNKKAIETEYGDLVKRVEDNPFTENYNFQINKENIIKTLKAVVLLSQVKPHGIKAEEIFPFVYEKDYVSDSNKLRDCLEVLVKENYITGENGIYKPIRKKEADTWQRIRNEIKITESMVLNELRDRISKSIIPAVKEGNKFLLKGKINGFDKDLILILNNQESNGEYPGVFTTVPLLSHTEKLLAKVSEEGNDKDKVFIIPKADSTDELFKLTEFYLKMDEALERMSDFGIDNELKSQIEIKKDTEISKKISILMEAAFKNATIHYLGNDDKDFGKEIVERVKEKSTEILKKRFSQFFGVPLRETVNSFIKDEILKPSKLKAQYLKDLELIDVHGAVNIHNRAYSQFLGEFSSNGYEKSGADVIDTFSKGKFGWELDIIKIMTALALKNGDIRIQRETDIYHLPEDIDELTNKGPFEARGRKAFDKCKIAKVSLPDDDRKSAIEYLRELDPHLNVENKIKAIAEKIKSYFNRNLHELVCDVYNKYSRYLGTQAKEYHRSIMQSTGEIVNKVDDIAVIKQFITGFNVKENREYIIKMKKLASKDSELKKIHEIYNIFDTSLEMESAKKIEFCAKSFIWQEFDKFDEAIKIYKEKYYDKYAEYKKEYENILESIKSLDEYQILDEGQKKGIEYLLGFKEIKTFNFNDEIRTNEIGDYNKLSSEYRRLKDVKDTAIGRVFTFYKEIKQKEEAKAKAAIQSTETKPDEIAVKTEETLKKVKLNRSLKDYSPRPAINIDTMEKVEELDEIFSEIKRRIKKEIEDGKEVTLIL